MLYIMKRVKTRLILETYFDSNVEYGLLQKMLWNGYNLVIILVLE